MLKKKFYFTRYLPKIYSKSCKFFYLSTQIIIMNRKLKNAENYSTVRNGQGKLFKENNPSFDDLY